MDIGAWRRGNRVKKHELRREIRGKIAAADPAYKRKASRIIEESLLESALWNNADAVFIFVSMAGREPDTLGLIKSSLDSGKITAVPYIASGSRLMTFKGLNGEPFPASLYMEQHPFGFNQPGRYLPDRYPLDYGRSLIVVPGVAFTPQGVRLGNGGGFYDAFLGSLDKTFPAEDTAGYAAGDTSGYASVGICFSIQLVTEIPREPHDIGVQHVCTESGWYLRVQGSGDCWPRP